MAAKQLRHRASGAGAKERIDDQIARLGAGEQHSIQQRLGLLRGVRLHAIGLEPLAAGADRDQPVGPHLQLFVHRLHRVIIELVLRIFGFRCPDERFMGVGEARALEIRHRIGLAPDDVVQDPETGILQRGADAEDVVIAAYRPDRAIGLQDTPRCRKPFAGKVVIGLQRRKLVPFVIDRRHLAAFGAMQIVRQLKIVRWIGKDQIGTAFRHGVHRGDAITENNAVFGDEGAFGLDHPLWMIHRRIAVNPRPNHSRVKHLSQESRK